MDFIELLKRSFSRSERSGLAHFPIIIRSTGPIAVARRLSVVRPPVCPSVNTCNATTNVGFFFQTQCEHLFSFLFIYFNNFFQLRRI